jgi:hypothetical protein
MVIMGTISLKFVMVDETTQMKRWAVVKNNILFARRHSNNQLEQIGCLFEAA